MAVLDLHCCMRASSSYGLGFGAQAQPLLHTTRGLVAPRLVESSWPRDQTPVPSTGRQILNHWTTRKSPPPFLKRT